MLTYIDKRYRILNFIGSGGMGKVYLVEDDVEHKKIALKTIKASLADSDLVHHLKNEFELLTRLNHPNLCKVYDFGCWDRDSEFPQRKPETKSGSIEKNRLYYFTMEYVEGADILQAALNLTEFELYPLVEQICNVLNYIHSRNFIHYDIKPGNILVSPGGKITLMDLGLAREQRISTTMKIRGTLNYIAPEIIRGDPVDHRADLYSLGVTLYQTISHELPFEGQSSLEVLRKHLITDPISLMEKVPGVSPELSDIIMKLLRKNPMERFNTANAVIRAMNKTLDTNYDFDSKVVTHCYILSGKYVGRDAELQELKQAVTAVKEKSLPQLYSISGESGIGKSRLMQEIRYFAQLNRIYFVKAACYEDGSKPYQLFSNLIRNLLTQASETEIDAYSSELVKIAPELAEKFDVTPSEKLPPAEEHTRLIHSITAFILELAARMPLVVHFEDIHWADEESLDLLLHLMKSLNLRLEKQETINFLGFFVYAENKGDHLTEDYLAKFEEFSGELYRKIFLKSLSRNDTETLIKSMFGLETLSPELVNKVFDETGGNPYFIEEVMKAILEKGVIRTVNEQWEVAIDKLSDFEIPHTVSTILLEQLEELNPPERSFMRLLSVVGRPVHIEEIEYFVENATEKLGEELIAEMIQNLRARDFLKWENHLYRIPHNTIVEILRDELSEQDVIEIHQVALASLQQVADGAEDEYAEELATHAFEGEIWDKALEYCYRAGVKNEEIYSNKIAIDFFEKCLFLNYKEGVGEDTHRKDIFRRLADLYELTGQWDKRVDILELWLNDAETKPEKARVYEMLAQSYETKGKYPEAMEYAEAGKDAVKDEESSSEKAKIFNRIASINQAKGEYATALEFYEKSLHLFQTLNDSYGEALVAKNIGTIYQRKSEYDSAQEYFERSLKIFQKHHSRRDEGVTYRILGNVFFYKRNIMRATEYYQKGLEIAKEIGDLVAMGLCYNNLGMIHGVQGQLEKALEYYQKTLDIHRQAGTEKSEIPINNNIGAVYQHMRDYDSALKHYRRSLELSRKIGDNVGESMSLNNIGVLYRQQDELHKALEHYKASIEIMEKIGDVMRLGERYYNVGEIYHYQEDYEKAKEYYQKALETCEKVKNSRTEGTTKNRMAILLREDGEYDRAIKLLLDSVSIFDKINHLEFKEESLLQLALTYFRKGDYEHADKTFRSAFDVRETDNENMLKRVLLLNAAYFYQSLNQIKLSRNYYNKALNGYKKAKQRDGEVYCYQGLGNLFFLEKKYELAEKCYQNAISIESLSDEDILVIYIDFIYLYLDKADYDSAETFINRCYDVGFESQPADIKARIYLLEDITYINTGKKEKKKIENILKLLSEIKNQEIMWMVFRDLALYFDCKGESEASKLYYLHSKRIITRLAKSLNNIEKEKTYLKQRFRHQVLSAQDYSEYESFYAAEQPEKSSRNTIFFNELQNKLLQIKDFIDADDLSPSKKIELINQRVRFLLETEEIVMPKEGVIDRTQYFSEILEIIQILNSSLILDELLVKIVDLAIHFVEADTGCLLLFDNNGDLDVRIARDRLGNHLNEDEYSYSQTVVESVLTKGEPLYIENISEDERLQAEQSVAEIGFRSVMCMPLGRKTLQYKGEERRRRQNIPVGELQGLLYIDSYHVTERNRFSRQNLNLLQAIADQASIALINASLYVRTNSDALTQLYLRPYFEEKLEEEIKYADKTGSVTSLIMADVDSFREINRKYGRQVGDQLLKELAFILKKNLRISDICARYGGDIFSVLLPQTDAEQAKTVADKILESIKNHRFSYHTPRLNLGISSYPELSETPDQLLLQAEQALNASKNDGAQPYRLWQESFAKEFSDRNRVPDILTGDPILDYQNVEMLLEAIEVANSTLDLDKLLQRIVDIILKITGVERCILMLKDEDGDLKVRVARNYEGKNIYVKLSYSKSIPEKVLKTGEPMCYKGSGKSNFTDSMKKLELRAVMCVPLEIQEKRFGVIYVDSHSALREFTKTEMAFLNALARQIAGAIENARLHRREMEAEEKKIRTLERQNIALQNLLDGQRKIIGNCQAMQDVFTAIRKVATTDATVLIYGESGTGKESVAHTIHNLSDRKEGPFVIIDCGAIPENLIESELFGHEKGAFTGAYAQKKGKFEQGNKGTIFLDEISELPVFLQVKLLRVLQESEIQRIGGKERIKLDIRIVAATNKKLEERVEEGKFRKDLYYRLNIVQIDLPPLRERGSDIILLAKYFLNQFRQEFDKPIKGFTQEALQALEEYHWPGNIRELEHKVERAVIMVEGDYLTPDDLQLTSELPSISSTMDLKEAKEALEIQYIRKALAKTDGNVTHAAKSIGISRVRFHQLLDKYGIDRTNFKD